MKRKLTIIALAVGLIGALLATAGAATGAGPVDLPRGYLLLDTIGDGNFRVDWYDAGVDLTDAPTATQTLQVDSKCEVSLSGPQLIAITQSGGSGVGAVSHGLGVKTKNNCSTDQGLINPGQSLTISLGSFFSDSVSIISAEVDVEGKRNAILGVNYLPGPKSDAIPLTNTSDNGPDSGTGDNNIAPLDPRSVFEDPNFRFRAVEFYPVPGGSNDPAVAIEGAGDGPLLREEGTLRYELGIDASVFELEGTYDGILACGGTVSESAGDVTGTFTRIGDPGPTGDADCDTLKPYNLTVTADIGGGLVTFRPEGSVVARYDGTVTLAPYAAANPVPQKLRYDPETDGLGFRDMQWCTEVFLDGAGNILSADLPDATAADPDPSWCIVSSETSVFGNSGNIQTTWRAYGEGDPRFSGA